MDERSRDVSSPVSAYDRTAAVMAAGVVVGRCVAERRGQACASRIFARQQCFCANLRIPGRTGFAGGEIVGRPRLTCGAGSGAPGHDPRS